MRKPFMKALAEKWPSGFVSRSQIAVFTGGLMKPATIRNLDSLGLGPKGRVRLGRKIGYPVDALVEWLEARAEEVSE